MRAHNRQNNELRKVEIIPNINKYADGSCLVSFGDTKIICTATIENKVPLFLKHSGCGWITAEYSMLPRSCSSRIEREQVKGKQSGRSMEIQRLIGRSLRSIVDTNKMGEKQIIIDCDVIQADGGTRTASITGGYIALYIAMKKLQYQQKLKELPITDKISAISCGIVNYEYLLDLDFDEDSSASTDCNFVLTEKGGIVEIQGTAEKKPFSEEEFFKLLTLAKKGTKELFEKQQKVIEAL